MGGTLSKGHSDVGSITGVMDIGQWQYAGIIVGLENLHNFLSYFLVAEVYGQSQKASDMRACQRCHLVGEGHDRKERDLIACIAIG